MCQVFIAQPARQLIQIINNKGYCKRTVVANCWLPVQLLGTVTFSISQGGGTYTTPEHQPNLSLAKIQKNH